MNLILEGPGLQATPWVLALIYFATVIFIVMKLKYLHTRSPEFDTTKMFVISVLLSCGMRFLSWVAIGSLSMQSIEIDDSNDNQPSSADSSEPPDPDAEFYQKALLVLVNLPDFMIISAYVLLALVWAEAFIQSRSHWLSARQFRRMWLLSYLIFNACLYAGQLVLYTLLFVAKGNQDFLSRVIFLTLSIINFSLPVVLLLLFFYMSIMFAGFPYKSRNAPAKINKICKVVCCWTVGRIVWGVVILTTILQGWLRERAINRQLYSIVVVGLYLVSEIVPFLFSLDHHLLSLIAHDARAPQGAAPPYSGYGSVPTRSASGDSNGVQVATRRERAESSFRRSSYGSEDGLTGEHEHEPEA